MADHLATYLNDHLAGSTAAIEMLTTLEAEPGFEQWARSVREDVARDQQELEALMERLGVARSPARRLAGWMGEKLAKAKMRLDDREGGALRLLELLEVLALGIHGKQALWRALQSASAILPALRVADYSRLIARAEEQRADVEARRLRQADAAFGPDVAPRQE
jgi:hypothetical protein